MIWSCQRIFALSKLAARGKYYKDRRDLIGKTADELEKEGFNKDEANKKIDNALITVLGKNENNK